MIRAVGQANERFNEDALRMLRAIRFASQLGFEIESETFLALQRLAPLIENVSIERIRIEISKFFQGGYFHLNGQLLPMTGLCEYIEPFAGINVEDGVEGLKTAVKPMIAQAMARDESFVWTLFLYHAGIQDETKIKRILQKWTHSKQFIKDVQATMSLINAIDRQSLDAWTVYQYPDYIVHRVYEFLIVHQHPLAEHLINTYHALPIKQRNELQLNGRRIMSALNMKKGGPLVGKILDDVEQLVVTKQLINQEASLLEYVMKDKNQQTS